MPRLCLRLWQVVKYKKLEDVVAVHRKARVISNQLLLDSSEEDLHEVLEHVNTFATLAVCPVRAVTPTIAECAWIGESGELARIATDQALIVFIAEDHVDAYHHDDEEEVDDD